MSVFATLWGLIPGSGSSSKSRSARALPSAPETHADDVEAVSNGRRGVARRASECSIVHAPLRWAAVQRDAEDRREQTQVGAWSALYIH